LPPLPTPSFTVPQNKATDPFFYAKLTTEKLQPYSSVGILIPGKRFDMYGTRYGRGCGWYDRFLSNIPSQWITIGVTPKKNISKTALVRKEWDIPVRWLAIVTGTDVVQFLHI